MLCIAGFQQCKAYESSQPTPSPGAFSLSSVFLSCVVGVEECSTLGPLPVVPGAWGEYNWNSWVPFDPSWALVSSLEGLLLQGMGFSYPPFPL